MCVPPFCWLQVSLKGTWWTLNRLRKAVQGLIDEEPANGVKQVMLMAICEDPTSKKPEAALFEMPFAEQTEFSDGVPHEALDKFNELRREVLDQVPEDLRFFFDKSGRELLIEFKAELSKVGDPAFVDTYVLESPGSKERKAVWPPLIDKRVLAARAAIMRGANAADA